MSKKEELEVVLKQLCSVGDVEGAAAVTRDGLLIAEVIPTDIDGETFAAMTATMTGAAETAIRELKKGTLERIIAEAKDSKVVATGSGEQAICVVMLSPKGNLGLILLEIKKAAAKISAVLDD